MFWSQQSCVDLDEVSRSSVDPIGSLLQGIAKVAFKLTVLCQLTVNDSPVLFVFSFLKHEHSRHR